jgi:hypothetical protein
MRAQYDPVAVGRHAGAVCVLVVKPGTGTSDHSDVDVTMHRVTMHRVTQACSAFAKAVGHQVDVLVTADPPLSDGPTRPIHALMARRVDAVVLIGDSSRCGRADSIAADLRIPRLAAWPTSECALGALDIDPRGLCGQGGYGTPAELESMVLDWLVAFGADICARSERRANEALDTEAFRKPCLWAWEARSDEAQARVALRLGLTPKQIGDTLLSARDFAVTHIDFALSLARELGVWDADLAAIRDDGMDVLTDVERAAFERAAQARRWDQQRREIIVRRGRRLARERRALASAGIAARAGLTLRAWIEIDRELCAERES